MRNYIYIIVATLGLLLAMTSCSDGDEITRTLEAEETSVLLTKEAQDKVVDISVDKGASFTADWKGESWGSVIANVEEGIVTISTSANTATKPRTATVVVTLDGGFRNSVIYVTQNGNTPTLSVIPDEIVFDFMGGEFIAEVETNVEWSVSGDPVNWLDVNAFSTSRKMVLNAEENTDYNARSTTMTVTAGAATKEVLVRQDAGLLFIFPYLNAVDATEDELIEFEEARHSLPLLPSNWGILIVATRSQLIPEILYEFSMDGTRIERIDITVDRKYMPDFFGTADKKGRSHEIMLENNWEYLHRDVSGNELYWMDCGIGAEYHYLAQIKPDGYMLYDAKKTKPEQLDEPTFSTFPYHADVAWGSHKDVAKAWEGLNKGVLGADAAKHMFFNVTGDQLYKRRDYEYALDDDDLRKMTTVFLDTHLSKLYINTPDGYMLNLRFEKMLEDEGFTYFGKDGIYSLYRNTAKELEIKPYIVKLPDFGETYFPAIVYLHVPATRRSDVSEFAVPKSASYSVVDVNITR